MIVTLVALMLIFPFRDGDESCSTVGDFAEAVMRAHQDRVSETHMLSLTEEITDEAIRRFVRQVIKEAFEYPTFLTASEQQQAIGEFREIVENACSAE